MIERLNIEDAQALETYLRRSGRVAAGEVLQSRILSGGVSNRTVLVRRGTGEAWVLKQALAKLRVQVDWYSDPGRNEREAAGIRWLEQLAPPGAVPRLVFEDRQQHLLAMEAVPEPHENWKTVLLAGRIDPARVLQFAELLGTIQRRASRRSAELAREFADRQYFESLRLEPYYGYPASRIPEAAALLGPLICQTRAVCQSLVHGDFSPKNILLQGPRMVLVDHEVIHWGDPAFDVGFALTHLLSKAHHLPGHREALADAALQFWQRYRDTLRDVPWEKGLEERVVRHTLGCLLARVAGRSPLEYLDGPRRLRQQSVVVSLMGSPPATLAELVEEFVFRLQIPNVSPAYKNL